MNRWVGVQKGGTQTHIRELAKRFAERGHYVGIITTEGDELEDLSAKVRTWYVKRNPGESRYSGSSGIGNHVYASLFMLKAFVRLANLRSKGHFFDVASVHFALEAFWMRFVRWIFRIPYVFVFEGYSDLEARQARHANAQIALSNHVAKLCSSRFLYSPKVIPIGVDFERFHMKDQESGRLKARSELNFPPDSWVILSVGRLAAHKGIRTLLRATALASIQYPKLITVVVGDGPDRPILERIAAMSSMRTIRFAGKVAEQDLPKYYWGSDALVLTETNEGFSGGLVLLEAMCAGLPIVASEVGGIPETVENAALLVPPSDESLLVQKIAQLVESNELRENLASRGLEIARKRDWRDIIEEYESVYMSASTPTNGRARRTLAFDTC